LCGNASISNGRILSRTPSREAFPCFIRLSLRLPRPVCHCFSQAFIFNLPLAWARCVTCVIYFSIEIVLFAKTMPFSSNQSCNRQLLFACIVSNWQRKKTRTHVEQDEDEYKGVPKSFVFRRGKTGKEVAALCQDVRRVMQPNTATDLKVATSCRSACV